MIRTRDALKLMVVGWIAGVIAGVVGVDLASLQPGPDPAPYPTYHFSVPVDGEGTARPDMATEDPFSRAHRREIIRPTLVSSQDPGSLIITGDQELIFESASPSLLTLTGTGSLTVVRYYCPRHGDQSNYLTVVAHHGGERRAHDYCWACYQEHLDAVLGEMRRVEPNE